MKKSTRHSTSLSSNGTRISGREQKMRLVYGNAKEFHTIVKLVEKVLPDARLIITATGLDIMEIDTARVAMIRVHLPAEVWETFVIPDEVVSLGVEMAPFGKILARAKKGDSVTLERPKGDLVIKFKGEGRARRFTLALIDIDEETMQIPMLELPIHAKIPVSVFQDVIQCADIVSDKLELMAEPIDAPSLIFRGEDILRTFECELWKGELDSIEVPELCTSVYSLAYLKTVFTPSLVGSVELWFGDQLPLHLRYGLKSGGTVEAWLAPIIEDD